MRILISIVNYNGRELLKKNIPFILSTKEQDIDICVVDNDSNDESVEFLKETYPDIKIILSGKNLGYGRAHNLALETYSNYQYYVFMNNDIKVEPEWLSNLLMVIQSEENVGMVGPKILLLEKRDNMHVINSAGMDIDKHYMACDRGVDMEDDGRFNKVEKVDGLCGAVILIPREVIQKVKGFHPNMFLYYEDVDLSLRIKDQGYDIYYCGKSVVYHDHMASTENIGSFKRNWMNMCNRYMSIKGRKGIFIAIKETIWYLYSWLVWKLFYSKSITLKQYLKRNE